MDFCPSLLFARAEIQKKKNIRRSLTPVATREALAVLKKSEHLKRCPSFCPDTARIRTPRRLHKKSEVRAHAEVQKSPLHNTLSLSIEN
ncbi:hypothetical protein EVAR_10723_1 [Eumeta japonica]|uniref:Uncharacterized protein n=1 Tax=Eumeta variegata TaxID=151549 RepID=A0A4C1U734_EUMVA|nr:hypothetical protein EVAR_10723_1 [Eumeta japonica]